MWVRVPPSAQAILPGRQVGTFPFPSSPKVFERDYRMNVIVITSIVVIITLLLGALLAVIVRVFSRSVTEEQLAVEAEKNSINQSLTMGLEIPANAEFSDQLRAARNLAARQAARMPRGSNLGIGKIGPENQPTALDGVKSDPVTAVKIAKFHGWQLLQTGAQVAAATETATKKAPARAVEPEKSVDDLEPGVDYPFIEITEDMSPAEIRKARIANAKAKSAAVKALKAAPATAPATTPAEEEKVERVQEPEALARKPATEEPQPGVDYEVIEITDGMSPDEIRKARIANAKAKSAAMKAFKEAGGEPAPTTGVQEESVPTEKPEPAETAAAAEIPAGIPEPDLIEITDDMEPGELRKARIHNAKAKSAYKKALKEAGIDPASVDI
jgi:hypothetical protein